MSDVPINTIICGDCLEVMREWPDGCVDLVVTSPPYDKLRTYNGYEFDFDGIKAEIVRVLAGGATCVWIVGDMTINGSETGTSFRQALAFKDAGLNLHDTMIYEKAGVSYPETNRYYPCFEYMFVFSKGKPKTANLLRDRPNIWAGQKVHSTCRQVDGRLTPKCCVGNVTKAFGVRYNIWRVPHNRPEARGLHPATFPEQLAKDHVLSWSKAGDIVVDPMCGSGTTCLAAQQLGRRFIGIDISPEYCQIARERLKAVDTAVPVKEANTGQLPLFRGDHA